MKKHMYTLKLVSVLILTSFILYSINYLMFKDLHHILLFLTEDLAFIPIEVIVTVIFIDQLLERRERKKTKQKQNILLEVFFEEVGNELLCKMATLDKNCCQIGCIIPREKSSFNKQYEKIKTAIENHTVSISLREENIDDIYNLLIDNKGLFIKFLENPYLMEHDKFTDLLQSISHFYHEVRFRKRDGILSRCDIEHLKIDALRIYRYLSEEWIVYMEHLEKEYPYLFKFALENVPFDDDSKSV